MNQHGFAGESGLEKLPVNAIRDRQVSRNHGRGAPLRQNKVENKHLFNITPGAVEVRKAEAM